MVARCNTELNLLRLPEDVAAAAVLQRDHYRLKPWAAAPARPPGPGRACISGCA